MKTIAILLSACLFVFASITKSQAQPLPEANLTIFSEAGDKFFLILNGERQNNEPQTNLRVEDLPQPYYNAQIIFADKSIPSISKNYLGLTDANGIIQDVTYKIKKDKNNGKRTLKFFSMIPVQPNYVAPKNVVVMQYGQAIPAATTVTQTTTTTSHGNNNNAGVNVTMPGMNVNINVNDPGYNANQTTTTTTTTTSGTLSHDNHQNDYTNHESDNHYKGCRGTMSMSANEFNNAVATIHKQSFSDTKVSTAKAICESNCLSSSQISSICKEFSFEDAKLDFAKYAYDKCTDPKNYFNVNNVFSFSSSVEELNEYIRGK